MGLDQYFQVRKSLTTNDINKMMQEKFAITPPFTPIETVQNLKRILNRDSVIFIDTDYNVQMWVDALFHGETDPNDIKYFYQDANQAVFAQVLPEYEYEDVYYYRKFNALQNYFESYHTIQNCEDVEINIEILDELEHRLQLVLYDRTSAEQYFPSVSGFFYGNTTYNNYYYENCKKLLNQLPSLREKLETLPNNKKLVYTCWY